MIGSINSNPHIHWLNKKILPQVHLEPSQTSEMRLFVKIQSRHSELFFKLGVTLFFSKGAGYRPENLLKVNSLTGFFQGQVAFFKFLKLRNRNI